MVLSAGVLALVLLMSGRTAPAPADDGRVSVAASIYPVWFLASEIGGARADVALVVPAGIEPHDYEPTPQDLVQIEQARLIVLNGGGLEPWADDVRRSSDSEKTVIVLAGDGLVRAAEQDGKTAADPHVWLDPVRAGQMADAILGGFIAADPANRAEYEAHAAELQARLAALDREYRDGLAYCTRRDFMTSHAAFGYLADAYGLNQVALAGLAPDQEPSPADLVSLARFARERKIRYIFFEALASPKFAETLAREVGAQTLLLDPIEGLTETDAARGEDYFTKMRANLDNLKLALECTP